MWFGVRVGDNLDPLAQQLGHALEPGEVDECEGLQRRHKETDVGVGAIVPAGDTVEDPDIAEAGGSGVAMTWAREEVGMNPTSRATSGWLRPTQRAI